MPATAAGRVAIAPNVLLDGRLALFHETEKWLAVADLHFGYELCQRAAGRLIPLWGMTSIEARLVELLAEYQPRQLIIVGDLVHDAASAAAASELLARLRQRCEVIALAGNHDRHVERDDRVRAALGDAGVPLSSRALRPGGDGSHPDHWASSSGRDDPRWRRVATEISGSYPARALLDPARLFAMGRGRQLAGRRRVPHLALHSAASVASIDVSLREMPKECSASRLRRQLSGAMRATRCLDRDRHRAGRDNPSWSPARPGRASSCC